MGDTLYVGSCSGSFYALDRHDGSLIWQYDTAVDGGPANFHGNAATAKHRIVVGTDSGGRGHLHAFDLVTGEPLWSVPAEGGFPSDVAIRDGRAFAVTMAGEVRCVDLDGGRPVWSWGGVDDARLLKSSLILSGRSVFVGLPSGTVASIDAGSGETIWQTSIDAKLNSSVERIGDAIYVGDVDGRIHRLAAKNGRVLDTFDADGPVYGALTGAGGCLLALWGQTTIACVDPGLKEVRWSREASMWSTFEPLVRDGRVVAGTDAGEVYAMDLSTGETLWTIGLEGEIKSLETTGDVLYVGTLQGRLYAVRLPGDPPRRAPSE